MSSDLRAKRAFVIRLIPVGITLSVALTGLGYLRIPPLGLDAPIDRLILALRCDAIAALALLVGIQAVASGRGRSAAIDPLAGAESRQMQVHARYVQNTLEQLVLFVLGTAA